MIKTLLFWILGIFVGAIVIAVVWYMVFAPKEAQPAVQQNTTLPVSGSVTPVESNPTQTSASLVLATADGKSVVVNDFIHNGFTIKDTQNEGRYLLAGNLGYCADAKQCQAAQATNFAIYYNSVPQSFTIALTREPIGEARTEMEQFLLKTLGIAPAQMCNLNYLIGVTKYVNEQYSWKNLGFSFCPGAAVLPK